MKNFKKLGLVAGLATLISFGAEAQSWTIQNGTLHSTSNIGVGNLGSNLSPIPAKVSEAYFQAGYNNQNFSIFNAFGPKTNWALSGIGFNLFRVSETNWKTRTEGYGNSGSAIFAEGDGSLNFVFVPQNTKSPYAVPPNNIGQSNITDEQIMNNFRRFRIASTGLVQISDNLGSFGNAITDPLVRLTVGGIMYAEGVKVKLKNTWPDYVFKKDYKLRPLAEVEQFIAANNHLPDVPSEAAVKENGIDVANMDAVLLRKVEELTLYMIQIQKDNLELKAKLEALSISK